MTARQSRRLRQAGAALAAVLAFSGIIAPASADSIVIPAGLDHGGKVTGVYRLDRPGRGDGTLDLEWSDSAGRIVERHHIPVHLAGGAEVHFTLDLRRAVVMANQLAGRLSLDEIGPDRAKSRREGTAEAHFVVPTPPGPWSDYQIIMWQSHSERQNATLARLGINASTLYRYSAPDEREALLDANLRYYVENIATDFYSAYHRWFPDKPVNWLFQEAKRRWRAKSGDPSVFIREPSLSDPVWLARVRDRLIRVVRQHKEDRPLYYNLGDETGIADLTAFWDFDVSAPSLTGMRDWLRGQYGSLVALNREWGTRFTSWDAVRPMLTESALRRSDGNYAAWVDFKEWMDEAFARALRHGTDAVHAADPTALAAIEGGQIPGWGGYDYARLAGAVDVMELYDAGENSGILGSFAPGMVRLRTSFGRGPAEERRIWRGLLRGERGLIIWDEKEEFVTPDARPGPRGEEAAPWYHEIRGGVGALLINSRRRTAPVAILYSPVSHHIEWLLDRRAAPQNWADRDAETEDKDDAFRRAMDRYAAGFAHLGLQPVFLSEDQLAAGRLASGGYRVLVLPQSIAMAPEEAAAVRAFAKAGGTVIAEGEPARFDHHGRRLRKPLLADLFANPPRTGSGRALLLNPPGWNAADGLPQYFLDGLARILAPPFAIEKPGGGRATRIEAYEFAPGAATILAFLPDPGAPLEGELVLPAPRYVRDLRSGKDFGRTSRIALAAADAGPMLLALSDAPFAPPAVTGPKTVHPGEMAAFALAAGTGPVLHVGITGPDGGTLDHYSGNVLVRGGAATWQVPVALNDPLGTWRVTVTDPASGLSAVVPLVVAAP